MIRTTRVQTEAEGPFARQVLVPGWDQGKVATARVLVAGAGALGNAVATDLVLSGVGGLLLVDFDRIEVSNLSRTILFRRDDAGRAKAATAAARLREMALHPGSEIAALEADVVSGVGWGLYRRFDLIVSCVDSTEARAAIGAAARAVGVPVVFGGIYGFDGGVFVQDGIEGACIGCTFSPSERREMWQRYSCDEIRATLAAQEKVPTTQVSAGWTGAMMAGEILQLLHGADDRTGFRMFLSGRAPSLVRFRVGSLKGCSLHQNVASVREMGLSVQMNAGQVLEALRRVYGREAGFELGHRFLMAATCRSCGEKIPIERADFEVFAAELTCARCREHRPLENRPLETDEFDLIDSGTPAEFLGWSLERLGIPPLHLLRVTGVGENAWCELTDDAAKTLPAGLRDSRMYQRSRTVASKVPVT